MIREGKLTTLVHCYEEGQFKYSEAILKGGFKGGSIRISAKIPIEFLGRKSWYNLLGKGEDQYYYLACEVPRKGILGRIKYILNQDTQILRVRAKIPKED